MKRTHFSRVALTMAALALPATALPMAAFAQMAPTAPATSTTQPGSPMTPATAPSLSKTDEAKLDQHINTLHDQLKITPSEESQWNDFAQVMRSNAQQMEQAFQARSTVATMDASDNMQSYAKLAQVHAEGMQALATAFTTLYNSFPDAQKKVADKVFQAQMTKAKKTH